MAQRKPPSGSKPAVKKGTSRPAGKPGTGSSGTVKAAASKGTPASKGTAARKGPPPRKPGKSIVNQKQTPWGLIATTTAVVLFAVAVIVVVIATRKSGNGGASTTKGGQSVDKNDPYRQPALAAAMKIKGVTYRVEAQHTHVNGVIKYDSSPPRGGNHSPYWANCNGNVYDHQIANENAVHMLEHGAVWITYNPSTLSSSELTTLKTYVTGQDHLALSPFAGLRTPISLQAWGYQLFVSKASDPRIAQFIATLKYNPSTTPENASCSDPAFDASKSTLGHPQD
jgi:hypothetical protein